MRLLYALDTYKPNIDGVAVSTERIAKGLARRGHEVAVVAPARRFADYTEEVEGLPVYRIRSLKVLSDRWWVPVLPGGNVERAILDFRPDVVVVSLPFILSRAAVAAAHQIGVPLVGVTGTMPEWLTANLPLPRNLAERANPTLWRHIAAYYNQCVAVVGVTQTALRLLQEHGLDRPGHVISNGVSLRRFRPRERDVALAERFGVDSRPAVLYTGRLDAEKRMDVWLEAAARVRAGGLDLQFLVVGDGSEVKHLAHLAEKLELGESVKFLGFLTDDEYERVFSLASAFAIASPAELQSIVTLEAAASGLPIVAANAGALPELTSDGYNGYLFPVDDPAGMAEAIAKVFADPSAPKRMGRRSRMTALTHDFERTVVNYERLYRQVSGIHGGRAGAAARGWHSDYETARGA